MGQKPERDAEQHFLPPPARDKESRWGFRGKTVWDWLEVLIVPLVLVVISFLFAAQQDQRQQQTENQRAEVERELAEQRAQDEALQAYLNQMSVLLLEKDLRASKEDSEVRTLARARTLTVLGRLYPSRNYALMQFLGEAKLVQSVDGRGPIISLRGADLSGTNLIRAALNGADLFAADLHDADLTIAHLNGADLYAADLHDADLSTAHLNNASLGIANLRGADLPNADLRDARLGSTDLRDANLRGADLSGADLAYADLRDAALATADLSGANLSDADLSGSRLVNADLRDANLRDANLRDTDLAYADLRHANLTGANVTEERLVRHPSYSKGSTKRLKGATMPNGQKYEDWLKSKDSEESGSNGG